jgi:hypothetical protein
MNRANGFFVPAEGLAADGLLLAVSFKVNVLKSIPA